MDKENLQEDVEMELERIQRNIPDELIENLMTEKEKAPVVKEVIRKALDDPEFPEHKKKKYENLLKSGELDGKIEVVDEEVQEEIEEYLEEEIEKSIKAGRLPDRDSEDYKELTNPIYGEDETHSSPEA